MSYQAPGPYPAPPGQYGGGPMVARTLPQTVQRAFTLMLVGAGLSLLNVVLEFILQHQIQERVNDALNDGTLSSGSTVNIGSAGVGALIGVGMWIWMAFANRAGHNWARITGTVFFGIASLGLLADIAVFSTVGRWLGGGVIVLAVLGSVLPWLVGLFTVILLWRKESSAFFAPRATMAPPYYPPQGYGYGYQVPPQAYGYQVPPQGTPMQEAPPYPPQAPSDPWQTPGS